MEGVLIKLIIKLVCLVWLLSLDYNYKILFKCSMFTSNQIRTDDVYLEGRSYTT